MTETYQPQSIKTTNKTKLGLMVLGLLILAAVTLITVILLNRRKVVTPLKGQAATTTTITDNFNGASLDTGKWNIVIETTGSIVAQSGGTLNVTTVANGSLGGAGVSTVNTVTGDFSAEVTVTKLDLANAANPGSAELQLSSAAGGIYLSWRKNASGSYVDLGQVTVSGTFTTIGNRLTVPANVTAVKLKLQRIGSYAQGFADIGSGYQVIGTANGTYLGDGNLRLLGVVSPSSTSAINTAFDNFSALVNIAGLPSPIPGTTAECVIDFTVLELGSPAPSPTPAATPLATVTPSPTPAVTPTATPLATPRATPVVTPTPSATPRATATPSPTPRATPAVSATPAATPVPNMCQQLAIYRNNVPIDSRDIRLGDTIRFRGYASGSTVTHLRFTLVKNGVAQTPVDIVAVSLGNNSYYADYVIVIDQATSYYVSFVAIP